MKKSRIEDSEMVLSEPMVCWSDAQCSCYAGDDERLM